MKQAKPKRPVETRDHVVRVPVTSEERAVIESLATVERIHIAELMRRSVKDYARGRRY